MPTILNKEDFDAIAVIVEDIVEEKVEAAKIQTAAGFAEVHEKINNLTIDVHGIKIELSIVKTDVENIKTDVDNIKDIVGRIENVQRAEIGRADKHSEDIKLIKLRLKMA